jgi:hypothetical protein
MRKVLVVVALFLLGAGVVVAVLAVGVSIPGGSTFTCNAASVEAVSTAGALEAVSPASGLPSYEPAVGVWLHSSVVESHPVAEGPEYADLCGSAAAHRMIWAAVLAALGLLLLVATVVWISAQPRISTERTPFIGRQ